MYIIKTYYNCNIFKRIVNVKLNIYMYENITHFNVLDDLWNNTSSYHLI